VSVRRYELALTRQRLLERSSELRERVAIQSAALTPALEMGDRVRDIAYWARTHPALVVSVVVVVAVVRPRTTWRWTLRVWGAWKFVQRWRILLAPLGNAR
jgi:hypothetical protein